MPRTVCAQLTSRLSVASCTFPTQIWVFWALFGSRWAASGTVAASPADRGTGARARMAERVACLLQCGGRVLRAKSGLCRPGLFQLQHPAYYHQQWWRSFPPARYCIVTPRWSPFFLVLSASLHEPHETTMVIVRLVDRFGAAVWFFGGREKSMSSQH
jgi:hypothetical protein